MPELPEVETVVRGLRPLVNARIVGLRTSGKALRLGRPVGVAALRRIALGQTVSDVRRRGKYILVFTEGDAGVVIHLGMSGRVTLGPATAPLPEHTHVVFELHGDRELRFTDPRRFGFVAAAHRLEALPEIASLGPEPLHLDEASFAAALSLSRAPVKSFLLDQSKLAGVGNIYACEALYHARLAPTLPAHRAAPHALALVRAVKSVLNRAIRHRGTTLRDYRDAEGLAGRNQLRLAVYDREGLPCPGCAKPIARLVQNGRSTFFCASCQGSGKRRTSSKG